MFHHFFKKLSKQRISITPISITFINQTLKIIARILSNINKLPHKQLADYNYGRIVDAWENGIEIPEVSKRYDLPIQTVRDIAKR